MIIPLTNSNENAHDSNITFKKQLSTDEHHLVSIAVCTYNGERFLREQLDSLVRQTYSNKEIIVVDDCSTDNTIEILKEYAAKYPFLSYSRNEQNLGYVKNFEKVVGMCNGEYIALSDQDDIWDLNKIQLQVSQIGDHALIYHDSICVDEKGNSLHKKLSDICRLYEGHLPHPFLFFNCVSGHSILFHKRILSDIIPFDVQYFHDRWIAFIASERGGIKLLPNALVKYRQHSSSSTDLLEIKKKKDDVQLKFFTKPALDWIIKCSNKTTLHKKYFEALIACFKEDGKILKRRKLYSLLVFKSAEVLFVYKKSVLSKANYLRKMCFLSKYS